MAGGSAGGSFVMMAIAGWRGSVEISNRIVYNCNKCVLQFCIYFCSCAFVFAVVLIFLQLCHFFCSCANFLYDSYVQFCSCAIYFAVVQFFCSCTIRTIFFEVVQFTPLPDGISNNAKTSNFT
jgi:hypothetical protein